MSRRASVALTQFVVEGAGQGSVRADPPVLGAGEDRGGRCCEPGAGPRRHRLAGLDSGAGTAWSPHSAWGVLSRAVKALGTRR